MFAYCGNNPVMYSDELGDIPDSCVDINGDNITDYYVYNYTYYTGALWWRKKQTGHVYIYVNIENTKYFESSQFSKPNGFYAQSDLIIGDFTSNKNPTLYAYQAHKIKKTNRLEIVKIMLEYDEDFSTPLERSQKSLLKEWKEHNKYSLAKSAQNIDFDNAEEGEGTFHFLGKALSRLWRRLNE